jgi:hypothetical protein
MTTGRMTTALGALALGLATVGAMPALAQTNTGGTNPPAAAPATPPAASPAPSTGSNQAAMPAHTHPMSHVAHATHHPMHNMKTASRGGSSNPNAQDAAVDQLNQQSLQAAQQGKSFTPSKM